MILYDFTCSSCGEGFEDLVDPGQLTGICPACQGLGERVMSAAHVGLLSGDPARTAESLKRRSHEHSLREARKNVDQFASRLGGTPKSQSKWNIRSSKS
jgi:putative FmdB family regulatory protein